MNTVVGFSCVFLFACFVKLKEQEIKHKKQIITSKEMVNGGHHAGS